MQPVTIIDYGMGNLGSLRRSLEECGALVSVATSPDQLTSNTRHLILPGVGSFADGMRHLRERNWVEAIRQMTSSGTALLGICLGMQLLASTGTEGGESEGLNLIKGHVVRLKPSSPGTRIPHIGWNEVSLTSTHPLFQGIPNHTDFYFVHSYHFQPAESSVVVARTPYCEGFSSVVANGHITGVQFHPEKSQKPGLRLLRNFLTSSAVHA